MQKSKTSLTALAGLVIAAGSAQAGTLVVNSFANGSDAASGISTSITYTHLIDINKDGDTAVINGVTFDNTVGNTAYSLSGAPGNFSGHNSPADNSSGLDVLMDNFKYGGKPATLTLTGLTSGETYKLRLYVGGFGSAEQTFTFDDTKPGATTVTDIPRDAGNGAVPGSIDYTYTLGAGDTDLVVTVGPEAENPNDTFHFYGFSNEVVPEPSSLALMGLGGLCLIKRRRRA